MRAFRILTLSVLAAATVATGTVSQAQTRRARPNPNTPPAPATAPAAAPIPPVAQAPGDIAPNAPTLLSRESEIRRGLGFQAFIDGQYSLPSKTDTTDRGFTVNDAAIYLSKDFGSGLAAMIDLPFGTPDGATNNGVAFGEEKAQAFLQWNTDVLQTKFGQFDTIFGVEQNDSKDRFFADAGLVKSNIIPLTHTGALVGAGFSNFMIRGLIADPRNTSTQTNTNLEFGVQGRFDMAPFYVAAGALYNQAKVADARTNLLIDVMAGFRAESFRIDAFYDNNKVAGVDDASNSLGVLGTFDLSPAFGLGGRLEWAGDVANGTTEADAISVAVGPSWKVLPEVTLRGDVSFTDVDYTDASAVEDRSVFGLNVSAVALF